MAELNVTPIEMDGSNIAHIDLKENNLWSDSFIKVVNSSALTDSTNINAQKQGPAIEVESLKLGSPSEGGPQYPLTKNSGTGSVRSFKLCNEKSNENQPKCKTTTARVEQRTKAKAKDLKALTANIAIETHDLSSVSSFDETTKSRKGKLTKQDLSSLEKKVNHLTKRALKTIESNPSLTHETVLEWCHQSALTMVKAMKPRNQKTFLRKLSEQVQISCTLHENLVDHKEVKNIEWASVKTKSDEFAKLQSQIDQSLEKLQRKLLNKNLEAEILQSKYRNMLSERQITSGNPYQGLTLGEGKMLSSEGAIRRQINEVKSQQQSIK